MKNVQPQKRPRRKRRYHPVDIDAHSQAFEIENPDWLVGAN